MIRLWKKAMFWMGIVAVLLIVCREFIFPTSRWQNVLAFANLPLFALLHTFFPDILSPLPAGSSYTMWEAFLRYLPYYLLYIGSYVFYGFLIDLILAKIRKKRDRG